MCFQSGRVGRPGLGTPHRHSRATGCLPVGTLVHSSARTPAAQLALRRVLRQPFLERSIHASLPTWTARTKGAHHVGVQANGDLFLGGIPVRTAGAAKGGNGCRDAPPLGTDAFRPVDGVGAHRDRDGGGLGRGDLALTKGMRSRLPFAVGRHSGRRSDARSCLRAGSRPGRRLDRATCQGFAAAAPHRLRDRLPPRSSGSRRPTRDPQGRLCLRRFSRRLGSSQVTIGILYMQVASISSSMQKRA